ncbi:MAG: RecX family transcriptional regulator [Clostridiaceae bacterium]|nr:RecX family transcriptional regulator [Clostridiaceae bacterium]
MNNSDTIDQVRSTALIYIAKRRLTGFELKEKLKKKGYSQRLCEETVAYFTDMGYINDFDYAERFIMDAVSLKQHGTMRIERDLASRGIEKDVISKAIESLEIDNLETLRQLVAANCRSLDLSNIKDRNRLFGFLVRKGFRYDEINVVLRERE